jgi:hypothetical protein
LTQFHFPWYSINQRSAGVTVRHSLLRFAVQLGATVTLFTVSSVPAAYAGSPTLISINTQTPVAIPQGLSGFNAPQMRNGVEYYDPKFLAAVAPLKAGCLRFPAGTASMDFDWNAGHVNMGWMTNLTGGNPVLVPVGTTSILTSSQQLTQAKGGLWLSDYAAFAKTLGANSLMCVNGFTDNNPGSTALFAQATQGYGLNVIEWELDNEPYVYPLIYPTPGVSAQPDPAVYAAAMNSPYYNDLISVIPSATVGLFSVGLFPGIPGNYTGWDTGLSTYAPRYWNAASVHIYPIQFLTPTATTMQTLNGVLAHGSVDYFNSYLLPLVGAHTPVFLTEFNCCTPNSFAFSSYLYNGIFLAEYIMRLSTVPNVKAVAVNSLYTDNYDYHGAIQSVNDFESYLLGQVAANPNYYTNTATDPNTQYQFYTSAPGLALEVANQVINSSSYLWSTTVTGAPTVPIVGYDGNPIPAIYAQAYRGSNNTSHYLLITNKAAAPLNVGIQVNGAKLTKTLTVTSVSNSSPTAANTAAAPNTVQIQTIITTTPLVIGPNSVTSVTW